MDFGKLLNALLSNPELLGKIASAIGSLFKHAPAPVPAAPVTVPTPIPGRDSGAFPDDYIPAPSKERKIARVTIKLARIQLNGQRFPDAPDNGLVPVTPEHETGAEAIPYASKIWFDLTAYDEAGKEFLRDAVIAANLCYQTEHFVGDAHAKGLGGSFGSPNPGYLLDETNSIGLGSTAWISSGGFLLQTKAHEEGTYEAHGFVGGVQSNSITFKVS